MKLVERVAAHVHEAALLALRAGDRETLRRFGDQYEAEHAAYWERYEAEAACALAEGLAAMGAESRAVNARHDAQATADAAEAHRHVFSGMDSFGRPQFRRRSSEECDERDERYERTAERAQVMCERAKLCAGHARASMSAHVRDAEKAWREAAQAKAAARLIGAAELALRAEDPTDPECAACAASVRWTLSHLLTASPG